ncbi:MAG: adenosylmethionine decarboxylase [Deltaproteobacteria bacterium]|nr:adenosylmethionine decarboxylase [Deltaproteobacteria bacterium]
MQLSIIVATLEGCPFDAIDDPALIDRALTEAVQAGGFTLLNKHVHEFEPQGVTGAAVLSESHIALHSWPETGVLFVDLATCSGAAATNAAFARICALIPHTTVRRHDVGYRGRTGRDQAALTHVAPIDKPTCAPWRRVHEAAPQHRRENKRRALCR